MKFAVKHVLDVTLEEIETSFTDKRYPLFLLRHHPLVEGIRTLEVRPLQNLLVRRIQYLLKPIIQTVGFKKVEPAWFSFTEHSTYNFKTKVLSFTNEPDIEPASSVLSNQGELRFSALGNKTERIATGHISLCLPERLGFLAPLGEYLIRREGLKMLSGEVFVMERFAKEVLRNPC